MKTMILSLALGVATLAGTSHATDLEVLEKRVRAYATRDPQAFKNPCVCNEPNEFEGAAGILRYTITDPWGYEHYVRVWCQAWRFDHSGEPAATKVCDTFTVLAK